MHQKDQICQLKKVDDRSNPSSWNHVTRKKNHHDLV